ncbi:hypothetical protein [Nocardia fluminea]|uniref:hypothetical protein n=1 Tax=Nocardia fluminea TaxID=134984 RepID=UPI00365C3EFF
MGDSSTVISIGAACFGIVVGYVVYRSLARSGPTSSVSDIAAVIGAIGGGVVTTVFDPTESDAFGYYSIGLLAGMVLYPIVATIFGKKVERLTGGEVLLGGDPRPERVD